MNRVLWGNERHASMPKPPAMEDLPVNRSSNAIRWALRPSAILALAIIVVLSVVPGDFRPSTGASGNFEHFTAYAGTAGLLTLSRALGPSWSIGVLMTVLAGSLEMAQLWIPGRAAGWDNFLASTAGGLAGVIVGHLVGRNSGAWTWLDERSRDRT